MSPRFEHGDYVLSWRGLRPRYQCGNIVVLKHPQLGIIIKRILNTRINTNTHCQEILLTGENPASSSPADMGWQPTQRVLGKVFWHIAQPSKNLDKTP